MNFIQRSDVEATPRQRTLVPDARVVVVVVLLVAGTALMAVRVKDAVVDGMVERAGKHAPAGDVASGLKAAGTHANVLARGQHAGPHGGASGRAADAAGPQRSGMQARSRSGSQLQGRARSKDADAAGRGPSEEDMEETAPPPADPEEENEPSATASGADQKGGAGGGTGPGKGRAGRRKGRGGPGAWRWRPPLGVAHRGASAELPEHTLEGYRLAVQEGADFIECDVVLSSDLVPHCRHEPNLAATTDALKRFPDRQRTYSIDGEQVAGVFSVDLTAAEMATLRAVQPWPFRNQSYNGRCGVPTLEQYLLVAKEANRTVGVYPETKHPKWTNGLPTVKAANTTIEDILLAKLREYGFDGAHGSPKWRRQPVYIQSFEASSLRYMASRTCAPMVLLLGDWEGWTAPDSGLTLEQLTSDASLQEVRLWAAAVGASKASLVEWVEGEEGEGQDDATGGNGGTLQAQEQKAQQNQQQQNQQQGQQQQGAPVMKKANKARRRWRRRALSEAAASAAAQPAGAGQQAGGSPGGGASGGGAPQQAASAAAEAKAPSGAPQAAQGPAVQAGAGGKVIMAAAAKVAGGRYESSGLVEQLHAYGLAVHTYTLRPEPRFFLPHLAPDNRTADPRVDVSYEYDLLLREAVQVDGVFTDHMPSYRAWVTSQQDQGQGRQGQGSVWDRGYLGRWARQGMGAVGASGGPWGPRAKRARGATGARASRPGDRDGKAVEQEARGSSREEGAKEGGQVRKEARLMGEVAAEARVVRQREGGGRGGRVWSEELRCEVYRPPAAAAGHGA